MAFRIGGAHHPMSSNLAAVPFVIYRFDRFELLPETEELRKNGTRIHLAPQAFRVLLLLVRSAGAMVTRDEIQQALWGAPGEEVFVDYEQGINTAIRRIRYALNDHAETPHFLQTVRRRGYRFVAAVECVAPAPPATSIVELHLVDEPAWLPDEWLPEAAPSVERVRRVSRFLSLIVILPILFATRGPHTAVAQAMGKGPLRVAIEPMVIDRTRKPPVDPRLVADELRMHLSQLQPQLVRVVEPGAPSDVRIETTLQDASKAVRVSAKMIETHSGRQVWSETLNRELADTSDFPLEIALRVTRAVSSRYIGPGREEPLVKSRVSAAALTLYREARALRGGPLPQRDLDGALVRFQKAVELEPEFAEAWSGIGDIWSERAMVWMGESRAVAVTQARIAVKRAIAIDPRCAEALSNHGRLMMQHDRNYAEAETWLRRAAAADPEYVHVHLDLATLLSAMGEHEQAVASFRRAQLLEPNALVPSATLAFLYLVAHRPDDAMSEYHQVLLLLRNPFLAHWGMMWSAMSMRRWDVAARSLSAILQEPVDLGGDIDSAARFRQEFRRLEPRLVARERARRVDPYVLACFYSETHDADKAFAALDRAIKDDSLMAVYTFVDPRLEFIRADPRFDARLVKLGFRR